MTFPQHRPAKPVETYTPRVFGFKLHPTAYELPTAAAPGRDKGKSGSNKEPASGDSKAAAAGAASNQGEASGMG